MSHNKLILAAMMMCSPLAWGQKKTVTPSCVIPANSSGDIVIGSCQMQCPSGYTLDNWNCIASSPHISHEDVGLMGTAWVASPELGTVSNYPSQLTVSSNGSQLALTCDISENNVATNCKLQNGATLDEVMTDVLQSTSRAQKSLQERYDFLLKAVTDYLAKTRAIGKRAKKASK